MSPTIKPPRILVIDDSLMIRELIADYLKDSGYILETAASGDEGWNHITATTPDLIISDWSMPGLSGLELCQKVRQDPKLEHIYFLLLTARDGSADLVAGLNAGADEFISKPIHAEELKARIRAGLRLHHLTQALLSTNEQLQAQNDLLASMSLVDGLTGVLNHRALETALPGLLQQIRDRDAEIVEGGNYILYYRYMNLWMLEIDQYADILEQYDQKTLDQVVQVVGRRLQGNTLPGTLLYRYNDSRFVAIKLGLNPDRGLAFGELLRTAVVQAPIKLPGNVMIPVTITLGGTVISSNRKLKSKAVLENAELALQKAQASGYNHAYILETAEHLESGGD